LSRDSWQAPKKDNSEGNVEAHEPSKEKILPPRAGLIYRAVEGTIHPAGDQSAPVTAACLIDTPVVEETGLDEPTIGADLSHAGSFFRIAHINSRKR
jgi:hypothetical protein